MSNYPRKPQRGQKALQSIYNSVCQIIDYLPSLTVTGDNKTTYVNHSVGGQVIHAVQPTLNYKNIKKGVQYEAGSGIAFTSGTTINAMITGGANINVWQQNGYLIISGTPAGSGGPGTDTTYIGDKNTTPSCHIYVSQTGNSPRLISSDLVYIDNLLNYPISGNNIGSEEHFTQIMNFKDGAGTRFDYHWNSIGDSTEEGGQLIKFIDGVTYNMNVSGGQYVRGTFHQGVGYGDYSQASIDCLLSGDRDVYSPVGFITIVPSVQDDGLTGGIISTILHGDNSTITIANDGTISCILDPGGATVIFKAPDFAKLQVTNDAGEQALGLGNTYLVPVSSGSTVRYEADGGTIVARWAPVEGSNENAFDVTTTNQSTPDDGYVRISVIDSGTLDYGCVRLYVNNKALPLHKFAKFNYSSGAIYEGGRYTTIQTTSTRINAETELEEEYTLENPIINNMLTGGRFITIQEEENNVELEYPRINCDLSEGTNIQITTGGVINCTLTGTSQLTNDSNYITSVDIPPSTTYIGESGIAIEPILDENQQPTTSSTISLSTVYDLLSEGPNIKLTKLADGKTQISGTPEGSGGGGGGGTGGAWPKWENMCGSGHLVYTEQWYTTSTGGWLRLSNPNGGSYHGCNSIYIDPVVPAEGVEGQNHIGLGNAMVSFFLPIPPGSSFWIGMPDTAECWFDGSTSPATHTSTDHAAMNELKSQAESARDVFNSASSNFGNASDNFNSASSYWESYYPDNLDESDKDSFYNWWNEISGYADSLTSQVEELEWWQDTIETTYEGMSTNEGLKYVTSAQTFYLSASAWATSAVNWAVQAKYYYDNCPT